MQNLLDIVIAKRDDLVKYTDNRQRKLSETEEIHQRKLSFLKGQIKALSETIGMIKSRVNEG